MPTPAARTPEAPPPAGTRLVAPLVALSLLAVLPACGHISNATIEEDSTFLAALPARARQALLSPEDATTAATDADALRPQQVELPWAASSRSSSRHQRHGAPDARSLAGPAADLVASPVDPGDAYAADDDQLDPAGPLPGAFGQVATPTHDEHFGVAPLSHPLPRLSPISQATEAFTTLGGALDEVFDAADAVRSTAPSEAGAGYRAWWSVPWHGAGVDVTMDADGEGDYAWEMSGADGAVFLAGEHAGQPTMETGSGSFRFDEAAWAAAFDLEATGRIEVAYDNRAGVALDIALSDVSYPDRGSACAAGPSGAAPEVRLGPAQRYVRDGADGDYQLVTRRDIGCGDAADSAVRVRWAADAGRADARIQLAADLTWLWSQCWEGAFDPDAPVFEQLVEVSGGEVTRVLVDTGDASACAFPTFAEVDDAVSGAGG